MTNKSVPFVDLTRQFVDLEDDFVDIFRSIGRSGQYILGDALKSFEEEMADYCGVKHAVGVANGTDALILGMKALGIGPGDEVITVPNSFISSVGAIMTVGATPRFVDVKNDLNMDPSHLERVINTANAVTVLGTTFESHLDFLTILSCSSFDILSMSSYSLISNCSTNLASCLFNGIA